MPPRDGFTVTHFITVADIVAPFRIELDGRRARCGTLVGIGDRVSRRTRSVRDERR
jgi:hypothetical protein